MKSLPFFRKKHTASKAFLLSKSNFQSQIVLGIHVNNSDYRHWASETADAIQVNKDFSYSINYSSSVWNYSGNTSSIIYWNTSANIQPTGITLSEDRIGFSYVAYPTRFNHEHLDYFYWYY